MACHRFAEALRAHAAGAELAPEARAHVERCDDCRHELARERRLLAGITSDLTRALQIEPSVEFKARVRQRIADNPAEAGSHIFAGFAFRRIALATASLAILAAVALTIVFRSGAPDQLPRPPLAQITYHTPVEPAPPTHTSSEPPAVSSARVHHATVGRIAQVARPREPEVLVPPDRKAALDNLIAMIRAGKIDEKLLSAAVPENADAAPVQVIAPIVVEELKVPPINVPPAAGTTEKR